MTGEDGKYKDIINLAHHTSKTHAKMSMHDRAAQFASFAALTGYYDEIKETARLTDNKEELDDFTKYMLDSKIRKLLSRIKQRPIVTVSYFVEGEKKAGGRYVTMTARLRSIDEYNRELIFENGAAVPLDDVAGLECDAFE